MQTAFPNKANIYTRTTLTAEPESLYKFFDPIRMAKNIWKHRYLISQMTWQDIAGRYKGSFLGLLWSLINPFLLLVIFTFVFSTIFKAKWGISVSESRVEFALTLFCGLVMFNLFTECINRAPSSILANPNYVKKTVFPLEILPITIVLSSFFHLLISLGILLFGVLAFMRVIHWTIIYLPLIIISLLSLTLGLTWFLSSFGVFVRDIGYIVGFFTTALFFLTPIFYPISAVPKTYQVFMRLNPLSVIVECNRRVTMWGQPPDWIWLGIVGSVSLLLMFLGYGFFMKSKRAFADVI
jgi:lipopolysaccharide transport system permease protein